MEAKLRSIADLIVDSWDVFTKIWVKFLALYLITLVGVGLLLILTVLSLIANVGEATINNGNFPSHLAASWPILVVAVLLFIVFGTIIKLASSRLVYSAAAGNLTNVKENFGFAFKHFFAFLLVSLVSGILTLLGFILLIIPGFYVLTVLLLVPVVFIVEEKHGLEALKRSRELVKGYFWPVFGRFLLLILVAGAVSILTSRIYGGPLISFIFNFVYSGVAVAYIYFIYKDLAGAKK